MLSTRILSDERIIRHVLSGERDSFGVLVNRYMSTVYAVAYAQTHNHADAEEVTQETFLKAFTALDTLRERRKFGPWVVVIARNFATRVWKTRRREVDLDAALQELPAAAPPDVAAREMAAALREHIGQLDEIHREVLLLHYFARRNTLEMGRLLGISRHAAKKRLERAREHLSRSLLGRIEALTAPPRATAEQSKRVMGAVLAAPVAWQASGTAAAATAPVALSGLLLTKTAGISVLAAGLLLAAAGVWHFEDSSPAPRATDSAVARPAIAQEPSPPSAHPVPSAPEAAPSGNTGTPGGAKAEPGLLERIAGILPMRRDSPLTRKDVDAVLDSPVSLEFENIHIQEVLAFVQDSYKFNAVLDQRVVQAPRHPRPGAEAAAPAGDPPQTQYATDGNLPHISVREVPLRDALQAALRPLGLAYAVHPDYLWVSTPEMIAVEAGGPAPLQESGAEIERKLDTPVSLEFENQHISEILAFAADSYNVNLVLDDRVIKPAPKGRSAPDTSLTHGVPAAPAEAVSARDSGVVTDGVIPYIAVKDIPLREALHVLLRPLGLAFRVEEGFLWVSAPERIENEAFPALGLSHASPALAKALQEGMEFEFEDVSLAQLLSAVLAERSVEVLVDKRAVSAEQPQIRSLALKRLPVQTTLAIALQLCGLAAVAEGDAVFVSTPSGLLLRQAGDGPYVPVQALAKEQKGGPSTPAPGPAASAPSSVPGFPSAAPSLALLDIQQVGDHYRAQIQTAGAVKWYNTGDMFERYELKTISPEEGRCVLREAPDKTIVLQLARELRQ